MFTAGNFDWPILLWSIIRRLTYLRLVQAICGLVISPTPSEGATICGAPDC